VIELWSDEDDVIYASGHVAPDVIVGAAVAFMRGCGLDDDEISEYRVEDVQHLWSVDDPDDEERFHFVSEGTTGAQPITRITPG
jgi:hypothetical protein